LAKGLVEISQWLQQHVVGAADQVLSNPPGDVGLITPGHDGIHETVAATARKSSSV